MIIRPATLGDLQQILTIDKETITPSWSYESFLNEIHIENSHFEIAVSEHRVVGFYILRCIGFDAELLRIAVDEKYQKTGIATGLMTSMLEYSYANNIKKIFLEVRQSNKAAIALYKKFGFKQLARRKDYYINPVEDAIIMEYKNDNFGDRDIM